MAALRNHDHDTHVDVLLEYPCRCLNCTEAWEKKSRRAFRDTEGLVPGRDVPNTSTMSSLPIEQT